MKRLFLFITVCAIAISGFAQLKPASFKRNNEVYAPKPTFQYDGDVIGLQPSYSIVSNRAILDDPSMGWSYYDLQTNNSMQHRVHLHSDGSVAGTFIMSKEQSGYSDRGTGYRYFDGTAWGPEPSVRVEGSRAGWPSYAPLGPTGEIVISHRGSAYPMYVNTRPVKGTGDWTELILEPPTDASGLDWPRMVTTGPDNMYVHMFAVTGPSTLSGWVWNGLDGALIYNRSLDGGVTWDGWRLLDGMTSTEYLGWSADTYALDAVGETICLVEGDSWNDLFLMKSTDNGDTWEKTIIWPSQYNLWTGTDSISAFYAPDGSIALALDQYGTAHISFGHMRVGAYEGGGKFWTINHDGLCYWNENMPLPPEDLDPDELYAQGMYIGWVEDTAAMYQELTSTFAYYYKSMTTFPTITVDDWDNVFVMWSSMIMDLDVNGYHFRNIYARASTDLGVTWRDPVNLTGSIFFLGYECIQPSVSMTSDDHLYIVFQQDTEGGLFLQSTGSGYQGQFSSTTNQCRLIKPAKVDIINPGVGVNEQKGVEFYLSQNYPNPAISQTAMKLILTAPTSVSVNVYSILGQTVQKTSNGVMAAGNHELIIDATGLQQGVYFISVKVGDQVQTRKMIVE